MVHTKKMTSHGSVCVPADIRRSLGIQNRDPMDVYEEDGRVILIPHAPRCILCESNEGVLQVLGKRICSQCLRRLQTLPEQPVKGGEEHE